MKRTKVKDLTEQEARQWRDKRFKEEKQKLLKALVKPQTNDQTKLWRCHLCNEEKKYKDYYKTGDRCEACDRLLCDDCAWAVRKFWASRFPDHSEDCDRPFSGYDICPRCIVHEMLDWDCSSDSEASESLPSRTGRKLPMCFACDREGLTHLERCALCCRAFCDDCDNMIKKFCGEHKHTLSDDPQARICFNCMIVLNY